MYIVLFSIKSLTKYNANDVDGIYYNLFIIIITLAFAATPLPFGVDLADLVGMLIKMY